MMRKRKTPCVYIVDDEADFVDAVSLLLRTASIRHAGFTDSKVFLQAIRPEQQACILLDVRMPLMSGLEVQDELLRLGCHQPVIFLTGHGDIPMAVRATRMGAFEFLEKPINDTLLLNTVRSALKKDLKRCQLDAEKKEQLDRISGLTRRELQVGKLLVEGLSNTQMAERLNLSVRTVEMHRLRMMRRLSVNNTAQAVKLLSDLPPEAPR
jgi:two-component system response regulator DctR